MQRKKKGAVPGNWRIAKCLLEYVKYQAFFVISQGIKYWITWIHVLCSLYHNNINKPTLKLHGPAFYNYFQRAYLVVGDVDMHLQGLALWADKLKKCNHLLGTRLTSTRRKCCKSCARFLFLSIFIKESEYQ